MTQSSDRYKKLIEEKSVYAPLCLCGCGHKTQWSIRSKSYGKYLFKHYTKDLSGAWTDRIDQIVRGTSIGDGNLSMIKSRKGVSTGVARLRVRHSTKRQKSYCTWLYNELKPIIHGDIRIRKTPMAFGAESVDFCTASLPQLYNIYMELYDDNGVKHITRDYLNKLTDLSVAIWWSDDGSTAAIATHSFSLDENELIRDWFRDRYGIQVFIKLDKRVQLPYIQIPSDAMKQFGRHIYNHVHESLYYKFARFQSYFNEWSNSTQ
jgi:hypothetical protein